MSNELTLAPVKYGWNELFIYLFIFFCTLIRYPVTPCSVCCA